MIMHISYTNKIPHYAYMLLSIYSEKCLTASKLTIWLASCDFERLTGARVAMYVEAMQVEQS